MQDRRQLLASLTMIGATAFSVRSAWAQPAGMAAPAMPGMAGGTMTAQDCIDSCWQSHVKCLQTERYCLDTSSLNVKPAELALLADCAEMCTKTANSLLLRSPQHGVICAACAQLCDACAEACERYSSNARLVACAQSCRGCAKHCRAMEKLPI